MRLTLDIPSENIGQLMALLPSLEARPMEDDLMVPLQGQAKVIRLAQESEGEDVSLEAFQAQLRGRS